jgi:hypothetical protein
MHNPPPFSPGLGTGVGGVKVCFSSFLLTSNPWLYHGQGFSYEKSGFMPV